MDYLIIAYYIQCDQVSKTKCRQHFVKSGPVKSRQISRHKNSFWTEKKSPKLSENRQNGDKLSNLVTLTVSHFVWSGNQSYFQINNAFYADLQLLLFYNN